MVKLFVYGTLRQGQPNNHLMQSGSTFIGQATTCEKYPLVIASPFEIPFLLNLSGTGHYVIGDVYDVTTEKLPELDKFENVPFVYDRETIRVEIQQDTQGC